MAEPSIVAARSKAQDCGRSLAGNAGSNPSAGMDVCLVRVLCDTRPEESTECGVSEYDLETRTVRRPRTTRG